MSGTKKAAAFGTPQPLPGQRGYKQRVSERMQEEAQEMEQRLSQLRLNLAVQKDRRVAEPTAAGHWQGARLDRGSVRGYGKEIKAIEQARATQQQLMQSLQKKNARRQRPSELAKTKREGIVANATRTSVSAESSRHSSSGGNETGMLVVDAPFPEAPEPPPPPPFTGGGGAENSKKVSTWTVADTVDWLGQIGLPQYCDVFSQNEISGPILLEVGLDDLDYMKITVLAHRKVLLKGIEDLKRTGRMTPVPLAGSPLPAAPSPPVLRHWSEVQPLSQNKVPADVPPPANLADGDYDEAAASSAFTRAVMEWRSGGNSRIEQTEDSTDMSTSASVLIPSGGGEAAMWSNPFSVSPPASIDIGHTSSSNLKFGKSPVVVGGLNVDMEMDEAAEQEAFRKAVEEWRAAGRKNVPEESSSKESSSKSSNLKLKFGKSPVVVGGLNTDMEMDEAAEQEAFRKAVEEWRTAGRKNVLEENSSKESSSKTVTITEGTMAAESVTARSRAVAEDLAKLMDMQHREVAQDLEERRRQLQLNLATSNSAPGVEKSYTSMYAEGKGSPVDGYPEVKGGGRMYENTGDKSYAYNEGKNDDYIEKDDFILHDNLHHAGDQGGPWGSGAVLAAPPMQSSPFRSPPVSPLLSEAAFSPQSTSSPVRVESHHYSGSISARSRVEINLLESTLGLTPRQAAGEELPPVAYVVEESDSD